MIIILKNDEQSRDVIEMKNTIKVKTPDKLNKSDTDRSK